jgi:aryl-alcohol dehydrogenase
MALELGATDALDPKNTPNLPEAIRKICPDGVDYIFDTTGIPKLLQDSMDCLAPHGCLGVVGIPPSDAPLPGNMRTAVTLGFSVMGIIEGDSDPDVFIPELIALYRDGKFPFERLVKTYPLAQINKAIADQHEGKCIKAVLVP